MLAKPVGVPIEHLQGGKLAIYELMGEESAVNYWEKYGNVSSVATRPRFQTLSLLLAPRCAEHRGADECTKW